MVQVSNANWHRRNVVQIDNDGNIIEVATNAKLDELKTILNSPAQAGEAAAATADLALESGGNLAAIAAALTPVNQVMRMASFTIGAVTAGEVDIVAPATITDITAINVAAPADSPNTAAVLVGLEDDADNGLGIYIAPSNYEGKPIKANPTGWKAVGTDGDVVVVAFFGTEVV